MKDQDKLKFKALFGIDQALIPESIIISPFFSIKSAASFLKEKHNFKGMFFSGVRGLYKGKEIIYIKTGVGATLVHDCIAAIPQHLSAKIIFLGAVGAVNGLNIGDCVLVNKAFLAQEYFAGMNISLMQQSTCGYEPDVLLAKQCKALAQKQNVNLKKVDVMSLHSLWAEDEKLIAQLQEKNIDAVELECAVFYGTSKLKQKNSLALCVVSDHLEKKPFWSEFAISEQSCLKKSMQDLMQLALDCTTF